MTAEEISVQLRWVLAAERALVGLAQDAVSAESSRLYAPGVSWRAIQSIEQGRTPNPGIVTLAKIAHAMGIRLSVLVVWAEARAVRCGSTLSDRPEDLCRPSPGDQLTVGWDGDRREPLAGNAVQHRITDPALRLQLEEAALRLFDLLFASGDRSTRGAFAERLSRIARAPHATESSKW